MPKKLRYGVIGLGNMGSHHARQIAESNSRTYSLGAVCDIVEDKAVKFGEDLDVPHYVDAKEMMDSGNVDAVIIATPHYWHAPMAIYAARLGLHVLTEKPMSSTVGHARAMIDECKKNKVSLGVILHHRSRSVLIKMRQMIDQGVIGEVFRTELIASNWFRTQGYYDSGAWRGTWDGEGGGVLINQAPHSLDFFQWMAGGLPEKVSAFIGTRDHNIEVEDTANIMLDYGDGKVGYIYATTAEQPGKEQLTVIGTKGTLILEGGTLTHLKLKVSIDDMIYGKGQADVIKSAGGAKNKVTRKEVKLPKDKGGRHIQIIDAFAKHVVKGKEMYIDGEEGIKELELSNAAYMSGFNDGKVVELPVDSTKMERLITKLEKDRATGKGGGIRSEANKWFRQLMKAGKKKTKKSKKKSGKKSAGKKKSTKKKTRKKSKKSTKPKK
ncbi:MAG: Gfo/Idh/MocA family protein [Phycisphaerae bacterium]